MKTKQRIQTRALAEGAMCVAMAVVLSYIKIPVGAGFGGFGGSVDLVMVPLIVFSLRFGARWGVPAGLAFGTLKYFLAGGVAANWVSILFDYALAYGAVGLSGIPCFLLQMTPHGKEDSHRGNPSRNRRIWAFGALLGCIARFVIHFISGVTVYAQYMPDEFMGLSMHGAFLYSLLYNGTYMLPNTVIAIATVALLGPLWKRFK